jgi:hypothetical protein
MRCKAGYSRYADDLTFSTNSKEFPSALAMHIGYPNSEWVLGKKLGDTIKAAGFSINENKTRMQCRTGRQLVTGLTVNEKVNVRPDYYRRARAMCHSLFTTGEYYLEPIVANSEVPPANEKSLLPLEGILSHIFHVKDTIDTRKLAEKSKEPTASRALHAKFLFFKYFVRLKKPIVVCEGKTDAVYLRLASMFLPKFHPMLGEIKGGIFTSAISYFSYTNSANRILGISGGTGHLKYFLTSYKRRIGDFPFCPIEYPVIVFIDNDKAGNDVLKAVNGAYGLKIDLKSKDPFYKIYANLYLVKTPESKGTGESKIEDLFKKKLLKTKVNGKIFNAENKTNSAKEYGKSIFAEKVVRPNADSVDFSNFEVLLQRLVDAIVDYKPPK